MCVCVVCRVPSYLCAPNVESDTAQTKNIDVNEEEEGEKEKNMMIKGNGLALNALQRMYQSVRVEL